MRYRWLSFGRWALRGLRVAAPALAVAAAMAAVEGQPRAAAGPATARGEPAPGRLQAPAAWALLDGFERVDWPDPALWVLPDPPAASWRPSACQARSGSRALRAFGGERDAAEWPCAAPVAPGALSSLTMRLDLRGAGSATRLELYFDLWLDLGQAEDAGVFVHLLVPQPGGGVRRVPVFGATAQSGTWVFPMRRLDLVDVDDIAVPGPPMDLRGGLWELEWTAFAPGGARSGGGAYLDNVSLVWEPDPALPMPTARPTATATWTPSATATVSPTATPRVTLTATASATPAGRRAFLPVAGLSGPDLATPTATVTATATITATVGTPGTATSTATLAVTETPAASDTPAVTETPAKPLPFRVFLPLLGHAGPEPAPSATPTWAAGPTVDLTPGGPPPATMEPQASETPTPGVSVTAGSPPPGSETPTFTARRATPWPGGALGGPRGPD